MTDYTELPVFVRYQNRIVIARMRRVTADTVQNRFRPRVSDPFAHRMVMGLFRIGMAIHA